MTDAPPMAKSKAKATNAKGKPADVKKKLKTETHALPIAKGRPPVSYKTLVYNGGTIYHSNGKKAFRVLPRTGDRVDKAFPYSKIGVKAAWGKACACIEADARPR